MHPVFPAAFKVFIGCSHSSSLKVQWLAVLRMLYCGSLYSSWK